MREFSLLLVLNISFSLFISAQICTVSVPALKGKYFGDCRHGKAMGTVQHREQILIQEILKKDFRTGKGSIYGRMVTGMMVNGKTVCTKGMAH